MSVRLVVQRDDGLHPGPDVVEPLLSTPPAAIARGQADIDDAATQSRSRLIIPFRAGMRLGQLLEVRDAGQGQTWRGQIAGIAHRCDGPAVTATVEVRRV